MRESSFINIATRNNVNSRGEGKTTLLFGHGFGCDQHTWRSVSPAFEKEYRVVLFDYVGAGKSELSAYDGERYSTLDGYAKDILEICHELELQNVIFIGHSVSSMIGLLALKQEPSIFKKIIFIGPSPRYINEPGYDGGIDGEDLDELLDIMDSNYMGWSQMVAPSIMGNADQPALGNDLTASFCAMDPTIARQFARVTFTSDNRRDLLYLTIPSLTIQCKDDFLTSRYIAEYINEHTTGNHILLLPSSGHCPHLSDPKAVIKAIKSFI